MTTDADPDATKLARDSAPQRPFPTMIDPDEALQRVQQAAVPGDPCAMPPGDAAGLRLAQDVNADRDYPAFDRAMMDGYAVRLADAGDTVEVTGEIAAGTAPQGSFGPGRSVEIMTGAPCPAAAEAVVPRENTTRSGDRVTLPRRLLPGQHIAVAGSECAAGATVVRHGDVVTPLAVAVMASFGVRQVRVYPPPSVGIVTTGAELVGPGTWKTLAS